MSGVRPFRREDVVEVSDLWLRVFRRRLGPAADSLRDYFRDIFFENPWSDGDLPSLVYQEQAAGIVGFLGVIPRRMTLGRRSIRVAVATQLMAAEGKYAPYAAVQLIERFFAGPQDLSLSDGANDSAAKLWQAAGGQAALLYSLNWIRILRPAQYLRTLLKHSRRWALIAAVLWPMCGAADRLVARGRLGSYWAPGDGNLLVEEDPSAETLLWCIRHLSGSDTVQPEYELSSLRWLLSRAGDKRHFGELRKAVVREARGSIAGWFIYYVAPGEVAQVLQFGGRPRAIRNVLKHLFRHAWERGAVAISGQFAPRFAAELARARCQFVWPGYGVLAQSRDPQILGAILQGDAFLTRLEGEWWARFSDPEWSMHGVPLGAAAPDSAGPLKAPRFETAH